MLGVKGDTGKRSGQMMLGRSGVACAAVGLIAFIPGAMTPSHGTEAAVHAPAPATATVVTKTFNAMSDAQRVGQLFMASLQAGASHGTINTLMSKDHVGNVILQGHWDSGLSEVRSATAALRAQVSTSTTRGVGMWIAGDQEGGYIQPFKGSGFSSIPSALVQGQHTTSWEKDATTKWGGQLHTSGINLDLAPVADVVPAGTASRNAPIGALRRNFGSTTQGVGSHVIAFVEGMRAAHVATAVKHFPGLGRVTGNTDDVSKVVDSTTQATSAFLGSFESGIHARATMVMISLAYYEKIDRTQQAAFSHKVITDVLRGQLGYSGVVISDSLGAASASTVSPSDRAIRFLAAGGDIMLQTDDTVITQMETSVLHKMATDAGFRNEVYASVKRVLTYKHSAGLL